MKLHHSYAIATNKVSLRLSSGTYCHLQYLQTRLSIQNKTTWYTQLNLESPYYAIRPWTFDTLISFSTHEYSSRRTWLVTFHVAAATYYLSLLFAFLAHGYVVFVGRMITTWYLAVHVGFIFSLFVQDMMNVLLGEDSSICAKIAKINNLLFISIVFPFALYIPFAYWILFYYNKNLIHPTFLEVSLPPWISTSSHSLIALVAFVEMLISKHVYKGNYLLGIAVLIAFASSYAICLTATYVEFGFWIYPVFHLFSEKMLPFVFIFLGILLVGMFFVGSIINRIVHGKSQSEHRIDCEPSSHEPVLQSNEPRGDPPPDPCLAPCPESCPDPCYLCSDPSLELCPDSCHPWPDPIIEPCPDPCDPCPDPCPKTCQDPCNSCPNLCLEPCTATCNSCLEPGADPCDEPKKCVRWPGPCIEKCINRPDPCEDPEKCNGVPKPRVQTYIKCDPCCKPCIEKCIKHLELSDDRVLIHHVPLRCNFTTKIAFEKVIHDDKKRLDGKLSKRKNDKPKNTNMDNSISFDGEAHRANPNKGDNGVEENFIESMNKEPKTYEIPSTDDAAQTTLSLRNDNKELRDFVNHNLIAKSHRTSQEMVHRSRHGGIAEETASSDRIMHHSNLFIGNGEGQPLLDSLEYSLDANSSLHPTGAPESALTYFEPKQTSGLVPLVHHNQQDKPNQCAYCPQPESMSNIHQSSFSNLHHVQHASTLNRYTRPEAHRCMHRCNCRDKQTKTFDERHTGQEPSILPVTRHELVANQRYNQRYPNTKEVPTLNQQTQTLNLHHTQQGASNLCHVQQEPMHRAQRDPSNLHRTPQVPNSNPHHHHYHHYEQVLRMHHNPQDVFQNIHTQPDLNSDQYVSSWYPHPAQTEAIQTPTAPANEPPRCDDHQDKSHEEFAHRLNLFHVLAAEENSPIGLDDMIPTSNRGAIVSNVYSSEPCHQRHHNGRLQNDAKRNHEHGDDN